MSPDASERWAPVREALIAALQDTPHHAADLRGWLRGVTYQYSTAPLSAAGSLTGSGGRFNAGAQVDSAGWALPPWPALYLATDRNTAYAEKFGVVLSRNDNGVSGEDLALHPNGSYSMVRIDGQLSRLFDLASTGGFDALWRATTPLLERAFALVWRLRANGPPLSGSGCEILSQAIMDKDWRFFPAQFGTPAASQIFGDLVRAAGFEGVRFRSTKDSGECIAVFPDRLAPRSRVALADAPPPGVRHRCLDADSAAVLCGWEVLKTAQ